MSDFLLSVPARLRAVASNVTTLISRWTQTKADYIDAAVSTRAPAGSALNNTVWTNARAARLDYLDSIYSSALTSASNPLLSPMASVNNTVSIAGLLNITPPYGIFENSATTVGAATYVTVFDIVGAGVISYLDIGIFSGASGLGGWKLTLDGNVITQANISGNKAGNILIGAMSATGEINFEPVAFRTGFKVEVLSGAGGTQLRTRCRYRRT